MKKFKYLIFLFIILVCPNVFAKDVTNYIQYNTDYSTGTYKGDEIALGGYSGPYSVKTRYQGRLSLVEFVLSSDYYSFDTNTTYTITLNMATNDWRNNFMGPQVIKLNLDGSEQILNSSLSVSNFQFVSRKTIKFNFKTNNSLSPYLLFRLYSTDYASTNNTAITGDSNWNLNSVVITDNSNSGGTSGGTSGGSTITNDSLSCSNGLVLNSIDFTSSSITVDNNYLNTSGSIVSNTNYGIIGYVSIKPNTNYLLSKSTSTSDVPSYCLSSSNSSYGSCVAYNTRSSMSFNSGNSTFLSFSIRKDETITLSYCVNPLDIENQNTQQIIDNQNQNTSNIIENNNDNTQQIIDNQNQNAQEIVDSLTTCEIIDNTSIELDNKWLNALGVPMASGSGINGISKFYSVKNSTIFVTNRITALSDYYCFYNSSREIISCNSLNSLVNNTYLDIPKNAAYFRSTINKNQNKPTYKLCKSNSQVIDDTITDDSVDDKSGFFSGFSSDDHGLSSIITIPLNTIQQLTNSSCVPLSVPIPFTNSNINLPCMTQVYETHIPTIYNIWQVVSFGIIAYFICIDIFRMVKGFKDPQEDKVEVLDL